MKKSKKLAIITIVDSLITFLKILAITKYLPHLPGILKSTL